jgi:3',5'-cyclic AMP phosphodiesterase CpdA
MTAFVPSGAYHADLDIRFRDGEVPGWVRPLVEGRSPNAECWLVVLPRRAGKTWLARGIERVRAPGTTRCVDLRSSTSAVKKAGLGCLISGRAATPLAEGLLLIDEPAVSASGTARVTPQTLAAGIAQLRTAGTTAVVFGTHAELALLRPHLGPDSGRDIIEPPALTTAEIERLTARAPRWAPELTAALDKFDARWFRTPFLCELILSVAERQPDLREDLPALVRAAIDEADRRHAYFEQYFRNGLDPRHRSELRSRRWRAAGIEVPAAAATINPLYPSSIQEDPIVTHHLPEVLRIHHISDLHHGGSLRSNIDAKDSSAAGRIIADLAGAGTPLDSYLGHVRQLATTDRAPHLVVVTGDVVNRPTPENGASALAWLRKLETLLAGHPDLRSQDPRIVTVGGNHDVSWDLCLDPDKHARHRWFAETFADYPHPDLHIADCARRRLFVEFPDVGLRLALLGSAESGGEAASDDDRQRLDRQREDLRAAGDDEEELRRLVVGFERLDPGLVARGVLDRLTPLPGFLTLAALHHPLSPVPTVEVAPYSGLVNAGQAKRALTSASTALVLHGHTHVGFLAAERLLDTKPNQHWTLRIAGAPALASLESEERNGYNEILVAREDGDHRLAVRQVSFYGGQWVPATETVFRPGAPSECDLYELVSDMPDGTAAQSA